jgi:hypothetical protein
MGLMKSSTGHRATSIFRERRLRTGEVCGVVSVMRKPTEFPSSDGGREGLKISSWLMQRVWVRDVVFAGGDRLRRSVRSCS